MAVGVFTVVIGLGWPVFLIMGTIALLGRAITSVAERTEKKR